MCDALGSTLALPPQKYSFNCLCHWTVMLLLETGQNALVITTGTAALTDFSLILCVARDSADFGLLRLRNGGKSMTDGMFSIKLLRM